MLDRLLKQQYDYMIHNSLFYKQRVERGELPDKINGAKELAQLPFTHKRDFRDYYPFGFLASDKSKIVRYGESTGTSGKPTASYITKKDWEENLKYTVASYSEFFLYKIQLSFVYLMNWHFLQLILIEHLAE